MAKTKFKITGFARFVIFLIIVAPLLLFGVSYLKGEDPLQLIKNQFGIEQSNQYNEPDTPASTNGNNRTDNSQANAQIKKLQDELEYKDKKIEDLYQENEKLKQSIKDSSNDADRVTELEAQLAQKDQEMKIIREQLQQIKDAISN